MIKLLKSIILNLHGHITIALCIVIIFPVFSQTADTKLPNRIGTGTHSSVIDNLSSLVATALRSPSAPDILRYKNVTQVEYMNNGNWINYNTSSWKNVLDSYDGNRWSIPYPQVRFVIDLGSAWARPSAFLIAQDFAGGERDYHLIIESSNNQSSWQIRLPETHTGSSNTAQNIFMLSSQTGVDRYIRITIISSADSTNPLSLTQVSAFTKRYVGLADNSALPFYSDYDRNIGIGTTNVAGYKLSVNGTIRSKEVKVEASPWPDYVFEPGYGLMPLTELEEYIQENGHLPEVPSAAIVNDQGIALGEMNAVLLKKIEELTLYAIEQQKNMEQLQKGFAEQQKLIIHLLNEKKNETN